MNQAVLDKVLKSPRLPSLPAIALEVIDLVQRDADIREIAETIQNDPALSSKILKTVNSSFYGQAKSISTISHALVVLGLNSVKTLALSFSLVGNLQDSGGEGFDHFAFWKRCLFGATGAKAVAGLVRGGTQPEEAFLAGLLQDIGMLVMNQALRKEYPPILVEAEGNHRKLLKLEREQLETDHAEIGAALAESWKLPRLLVEPIRFHERPGSAPEDLRQLVACIDIGNDIADVYASESQGPALSRYNRKLRELTGASQAQADELLQEVHSVTKDLRRLFDLPTGGLGDADDILAQANEALLEISLQNQMEATNLEQQNKQLSSEVNTDALTGVANRRRFDDYVSEQFEAAKTSGDPLSVLFLDTDHFKKFNDTYGHQVGDRVLVKKAAALEELHSERGLVARYGGEEFAIILPNTTRVEAARLAEQTRLAIAGVEIESDEGEALHVTASIGVATFEGVFFQSVDHLVKAADQGVYAAKSAGRNAVRIFTPPKKRAAA